MEYTIHGDTVNTASRLEAFYKSRFHPDYLIQPCRILISETMLEYIGNQFQIKQIRDVELRGKNNIIRVYQVIGNNIVS
jgi:adenylate cyclase